MIRARPGGTARLWGVVDSLAMVVALVAIAGLVCGLAMLAVAGVLAIVPGHDVAAPLARLGGVVSLAAGGLGMVLPRDEGEATAKRRCAAEGDSRSLRPLTALLCVVGGGAVALVAALFGGWTIATLAALTGGCLLTAHGFELAPKASPEEPPAPARDAPHDPLAPTARSFWR